MDNLAYVRSFAKANLAFTQEKSKHIYDKKTICRRFKPGGKYLVSLPNPGSPLKRNYSGPYTIVSQLNPLNYVISTPDRRKSTQLVHISLKPYY